MVAGLVVEQFGLAFVFDNDQAERLLRFIHTVQGLGHDLAGIAVQGVRGDADLPDPCGGNALVDVAPRPVSPAPSPMRRSQSPKASVLVDSASCLSTVASVVSPLRVRRSSSERPPPVNISTSGVT
ncbi:MAG: hypothetical protein WAO76_18590 [Georgfuchsia sp.]